ncbi:MAG: hypothetical protein KDJ23_10840 [Rhodoblastus sp.]|nr:hypothetical protein [Rhodoblastus sp.]MCB1524584.1 hypothetical protein [Rhodoblastus sp.]HPG03852.1 hypothetical protein [Rhodoblastus sp.]
MTAGVLRAILTLALISACGAIIMYLPGLLSGRLGEFPQVVTVAAVIAFLSFVGIIEARLRG